MPQKCLQVYSSHRNLLLNTSKLTSQRQVPDTSQARKEERGGKKKLLGSKNRQNFQTARVEDERQGSRHNLMTLNQKYESGKNMEEEALQHESLQDYYPQKT